MTHVRARLAGGFLAVVLAVSASAGMAAAATSAASPAPDANPNGAFNVVV